MTEQDLRDIVCAQAKGWVGRKEADGSHRAIIDLYNTIVPLPRGYRMTYSDPWCATFVSAVGKAVDLTDIIYPECACDPMIALYKQHGRWMDSDGYRPAPGDVIFYGNGRYINHVAIYIGNGQVVHASNARDGIKISNAFYRTPICIVSYLP